MSCNCKQVWQMHAGAVHDRLHSRDTPAHAMVNDYSLTLLKTASEAGSFSSCQTLSPLKRLHWPTVQLLLLSSRLQLGE